MREENCVRVRRCAPSRAELLEMEAMNWASGAYPGNKVLECQISRTGDVFLLLASGQVVQFERLRGVCLLHSIG